MRVMAAWNNHITIGDRGGGGGGEGGGVHRISSDRDERRIFGGLKFSNSGFFFGVGKFRQVFPFW